MTVRLTAAVALTLALSLLVSAFSGPSAARAANPAPATRPAAVGTTAAAAGRVLDPRAVLARQTFWDNRDWDWYEANIPFFESPDADLDTTYYYRWELLTKHLTYGSPDAGYVFTEFIDRPFWSGRYGAISCPAGHQLYEARWAKDPRLARDYSRYWFRTEGAQPRRYSTWLADAVWAAHLAKPDPAILVDLLPDLVKNYEGWEREHFDADVGLFWQTGHDDGMEFNINSRQSPDLVRGAPGYRPTLNAYLWADALAIQHIAKLAGYEATAKRYEGKAAKLKENLQKKLWDPKRSFYFPMAKRDETRDGFTVKAGSLTGQTGKFAGTPFGREEIGFVPWQFGLPDGGYESAWATLMSPGGFLTPFGPTTVERRDPMFYLSPTCCYWSGQSWPYATSQTLVAMANLLNAPYDPVAVARDGMVTRDAYLKLLQTFARTHRKAGKPYLAEAAHPDTGSWEGHDTPGHSDHYFHSAYVDLVVTGLAGLRPRADDTLEINPLAPPTWDYFALDDVAYHGRRVSILWDKTGTRYGKGQGLRLLVDGREVAASPTFGRLTAPLPAVADAATRQAASTGTAGADARVRTPKAREVNYAVNNEGTYYPRVTTSSTAAGTSTGKLVDGNYFYHRRPANRWAAAADRPADGDWVAVDFGVARPVHAVKLYLLDDRDHRNDRDTPAAGGDGKPIAAPTRFDLEYWDGSALAAVPGQARQPTEPAGHRANVVRFSELRTTKLRATFARRNDAPVGLSEIEAWGDAPPGPVAPAPPPAGNLALNPGGKPFPKVTASFTSQFDRPDQANDGVATFDPEPHNRWTAYESPNPTDWLQIDFGKPTAVGRVELAIYDDRGGVQPPRAYAVQYWDEADGGGGGGGGRNGRAWKDVAAPKFSPLTPTGGQWNQAAFKKVTTSQLRVVFTHQGKARSGVTEVMVWPE